MSNSSEAVEDVPSTSETSSDNERLVPRDEESDIVDELLLEPPRAVDSSEIPESSDASEGAESSDILLDRREPPVEFEWSETETDINEEEEDSRDERRLTRLGAPGTAAASSESKDAIDECVDDSGDGLLREPEYPPWKWISELVKVVFRGEGARVDVLLGLEPAGEWRPCAVVSAVWS